MNNVGISLKRFNCLLFLLGIFSFARAQNIVPNPSFEDYNFCPTSVGVGFPLPAIPWKCATGGSCDYYNACATAASGVSVPDNFEGHQVAHTGVAYAGIYAKVAFFLWREYLEVQLTEPMVAGDSYYVSLWVNNSDTTCGTNTLGVYFSQTPSTYTGTGVYNVTPQISANMGFMSDDTAWVLISACYAAVGGEQWMIIGNYKDDANTPIDPLCTLVHHSYYYVDDVSVEDNGPAGTLDFDLGPPVTACNQYVIDPGISGGYYYWSDGSNGPKLTVTQSGTYAVTITKDCDIGVDSIDVTILGDFNPVDLGPTDVNICSGDSYNISLDPNSGSYVWQDGSTSPNYTITSTGVYQVSLDDGCDVTTDAISVYVIDPPSPFSLGADTAICIGHTITYSFDPNLGTFHWQDNSNSPNYTISTAGDYQLTISNMCGEVSSDIVVDETAPPVIDLGPAQVMLCPGQTIDFSFDPDMGNYLWQDGSTSPVYTISGPGIYSLTVTNQCGTSTDQVNATLVGQPVFDLGQNDTLCPAQLPFTLDVSGATNASSYLWQDGSTAAQFHVNNAGAFSVTVSNSCFSISDTIEELIADPPPMVDLPPDQFLCPGEVLLLDDNNITGNYMWQDGSTSTSFLVTQAGTYSLTVSNSCGSDNDHILIQYVDPLSAPDLGPDIGLCPGEQYILHAGVSGVNYLWQNFSTADSFVVSSPGVYSLVISNSCNSASDTVVVTVSNTPPQVDLPNTLSLCSSDTLILNAGISGVQYLWNDGSQKSTLKVFNTGIYSITVSNACGTGSDSIEILDAGSSPLISLGPDIALCSGENHLIVPVSSGVNTWLWQDGSTSPTYTVNGPGTITTQVSNNCGVGYDTLIVSLSPDVPLLSLGPDTSVCPGSSVMFTINIPGVNILWSDGSTNPDFTTTNPGLIYATISNNCNSSSDSLNLNFLPAAPLLDLGPDQSLCPGDVITLSPGIAGVNYLWQDGSTGPVFNAALGGAIILTVSNTCGSATDTLNITETNNGPQVDLGPDVLSCEGSTVTLHSGILGVNYLWQDGSTNPDYTTNVSGTFIVQVSNSCGIDADTVVVNINGSAPLPYLGKDTTLCQGESILLIANPDSETSVTWQDGSTSSIYNVTSSGTYILSESNRCGANADTIDVEINGTSPQFSLGLDTVLCEGSVLELIANPDPLTNIMWQDGSDSTMYVVTTSGSYILSESNRCGTAADTIDVEFNGIAPHPDLGRDTVLCDGETVVLFANPDFGTSVTWQDNSTSSTYNVTSAGVYVISATNHCGMATDTINISYQSPPQDFNLGPDTILCPGESFVLNAPQTNDIITWQDGSHGASFVADQAHVYSLQVTNDCGLTKDSLVVSIDNRSPSINIDPTIPLCDGDTITLDASQSFNADYLWNNGSIMPSIQVSSPGLYSVSVVTDCQTVQQDIEVVPSADCNDQIGIPNVFSPNGDQVNDVFSISIGTDLKIISLSCSIFDRWGNMVFLSDDINFSWDGRFRNQELMPGVYVYVIDMNYVVRGQLRQQILSGDLTLIR